MHQNHPAGDPTRVSVVPVKMIVQIGDSVPRSKEILRIEIRLSYKECKEEKNKVVGMPSVLFAFLYCLLQWK